MKNLLGFVGLLFLVACSQQLEEKRLLVVINEWSKPTQQEFEKFMQTTNGQDILLDTTSNLTLLKEDTLKYYSSIVFINFQGKNLDYRQQTEIERYVQAGGAIITVNAALKPEFQWPWYSKLDRIINTQREQPNVNLVNNTDNSDKRQDENVEDIHVKKIDFDGGRVSVTQSFLNKSQEDIAELINYSIQDNSINYKKATSLAVPDYNQFTRVVLDDDLNEPMELDVLPEGKVIYIQRRGEVKLFDPASKSVKLLATFDVTTEGNYEDGLLGLALDPEFEKNRRVYFYYSVPEPDSLNRLSRFYMAGDSLIMSSEKTILEVPVQRKTCCHTGGAIQFGPDGLLYLSTGDNTSSKESDGYTPIDEREGRGPYDAQKSSGNTMDLRGKILRIRVNNDGSYSIPEGNLFPVNGIKGRPEIYVMGVRNPFRFSIDWKNNWLYWGDVGPDVGKASEQGPESFDEWNQARTPGNYGWPYFVADNVPYPDWDFDTNTPGDFFVPERPVNDSPNNTGSELLPPAQPAMMWYPYGASEIWPNLGTGSRSSMAGPVYYADRYGRSDVKFPEYYNGKLFIYEWARSWIKVVSFDEQGNPVKLEPFLPEMEVSKPIDMEFGPDGALYFLEYGANYFADNDEARLVKIEFTEGNRKPVAVINVNTKAGAAPLEVKFSGLQSFDYDKNDGISYEWRFTENEVQSTDAETSFTFEKSGVFNPRLTVTDDHGNSRIAEVEIRVGNAPPDISIVIDGNQSFFFDNTKLPYKITVTDVEDGSTQSNTIDPSLVQVSFDYLKESKDLALLGNATRVSPFIAGKKLIDGSDCKSCHDMEKTSIGPSYLQIAERYQGEEGIVPILADKIIVGGNGNWGHSLMAAHPDLSKEDATAMVNYILSLSDETSQTNLPLEGSLPLNKHNSKDENGTYYLAVVYKDKGANEMPSITSREMITLRNPKVEAENYEEFKNVSRQRPQGGAFSYVGNIKDGSYMVFKNIDLTGIGTLTYNIKSVPAAKGATISLRLNSPNGPVVSSKIYEGGQEGFGEISALVSPTQGVHDLYFVFSHEEEKEISLFNLDWILFGNEGKVLP